MVDVPRFVLQSLPVNIVAVIESKNVRIALGESLGTFGFGNLGADVLKDPCAFLDILRRKEALARNT